MSICSFIIAYTRGAFTARRHSKRQLNWKCQNTERCQEHADTVAHNYKINCIDDKLDCLMDEKANGPKCLYSFAKYRSLMNGAHLLLIKNQSLMSCRLRLLRADPLKILTMFSSAHKTAVDSSETSLVYSSFHKVPKHFVCARLIDIWMTKSRAIIDVIAKHQLQPSGGCFCHQ